MSLDDAVQQAVAAAVERALGPYLQRLAGPEPLVYSVPDTAKVLCTSTTTIRRLIDEGVLPVVPHTGERLLVPRKAVERLVDSARPRTAATKSAPLRIATGR